MKLSDYPPGFSTPKYRATPEELEELRRMIQAQREIDERYQQKLIEEGKIRADFTPDEKPD